MQTLLRNVLLGGGGGYSPASLFAGGVEGALYDPSDLSTLYQDSAGTTPVTGVEQVVGLMLDKSKNLALGPELVTNGDFSQGSTGWGTPVSGASIAGGALVFDGVTSIASGITIVACSPAVSIVAGRWYKVTYTIISDTTLPISVGFTVGGVLGTARSTAGTYTEYLFASSNASVQVISRVSIGARTGSISNISVRELPGNHAISTGSARPTLSARVNLLTYSEEFDNAVWLKSNLNTTGTPAWVNVAVAPDGTTTADKFIANVGTFRVDAANTTPVVVAQYSQTIYAQKDTYQYLWIGDRGDAAGIRSATFDLNSGTVLGQSNGTASIFDAGNGWWKCVLVYSRVNAGNASAMYALGDSSHTIDRPSKTWLGTEALNVWGADLRPANIGVNIPSYQRIAAATDYDTNGFPFYLSFGGAQSMSTPANLDLTSTDKVTVYAGVRKLSDAAQAVVTELSASVDANNGSFRLTGPDVGSTFYSFVSKGTSVGQASDGVSVAPITNVLTGTGDIFGDSAILRVNGAQAGFSTVDQGTGNFGTYPLFIGSRNNASLFFTGYLYSLIIQGAAASATQLASTEAWVNQKTKAY